MLNHIEILQLLLCIAAFVYSYEMCEANGVKAKMARRPGSDEGAAGLGGKTTSPA
jgi:hypothetical protein